MRHLFLLILLSLRIGYLNSNPISEKVNELKHTHGSHNLLKLTNSNNSVHRNVRCTPCEQEGNIRNPVSNHLNPEYRGNGADNLGYDWSPKAWGGPAFPRKSKGFTGGMRGRDGKQMPDDWRDSPGGIRIVCDTCRTYWDSSGSDGGRSYGRGGGRQYELPKGQDFNNRQPGYWPADRNINPQNYETKVSSPAVGVLVKPGSRIAYIPSRSGEMYWDGVSGGGTRWDGFSNGISWIGSGSPEWDRSDVESREDKPEYPGSQRTDNKYPYPSNGYRIGDNQKVTPGWDNSGKDSFAGGYPNANDNQWRDRGYASNWHYDSTNQNGWNGNFMKWNYGGNKWDDNDRAANQFYFNSPQDRGYGPAGDGAYSQYGNQYPNYQPMSGYPGNFRPRPWRPNQGFRVNDRDPSGFQNSYPGGEKDRPWDYTDRFDYKRPGTQPEWVQIGQSYPNNYDKPGSGKYPDRGYSPNNKYPTSDKNYDRPWGGRPGYGSSKPSSENNFPYGGNRYPGSNSGGGNVIPNYSGGGSGSGGGGGGVGNLFYPNDGNQPNYSNLRPDFGAVRPSYPIRGGGQSGSYPVDNRPSSGYPIGNRPSSGHLGGGSPSVIYTGGISPAPEGSGGYPGNRRPPGGSSGSYPGERPGYPSDGGSSYPGGGGYPSPGNSQVDYPGAGPQGYPGNVFRPDRYPGGGNRPDAYPSGGGGGGVHPGGYPTGGTKPSAYPSTGGRPDNYLGGGGGSLGGFPGGTSYPGGSNRPDGFPGESGRPGYYPSKGNSQGGYPSGGRPDRYPDGRPDGYGNEGRPVYPSGRPDGYGNDGRPAYPSGRPSGYPGPGSSGSYPQGGKNPSKGGYYTGIITELRPDDGFVSYGNRPNYFGGSLHGGGGQSNLRPGSDKDDRYFGGGNGDYSSGNKDRYPGGGDTFSYYGPDGDRGKYPDRFPSNHRYPGGSNGGDFDRNSGSSDDKNSWNYGQEDRKDGVYRRSGGSYPPYRGGPYYTSSYLASMSTTSGSTQMGSETKTQSITKPDEVTQPTESS